jgi:hypothetical protein
MVMLSVNMNRYRILALAAATMASHTYVSNECGHKILFHGNDISACVLDEDDDDDVLEDVLSLVDDNDEADAIIVSSLVDGNGSNESSTVDDRPVRFGGGRTTVVNGSIAIRCLNKRIGPTSCGNASLALLVGLVTTIVRNNTSPYTSWHLLQCNSAQLSSLRLTLVGPDDDDDDDDGGVGLGFVVSSEDSLIVTFEPSASLVYF